MGGFNVPFEERPFEWVYPQAFKVFRKMRSGPLDSLEMSFQLRPSASGGTTVFLKLTLEPRYRILFPFMRIVSGQTLRSFANAIADIDRSLAAGEAPRLEAKRGDIDEAAIDRAVKALREAVPDQATLVERLGRF